MKCKRFLSWVLSHCLSDIRQFIFLHAEREERVESKIHDIGNKEGKFRGLRRKDKSNEKLKASNTKRNRLPVTSKEMER